MRKLVIWNKISSPFDFTLHKKWFYTYSTKYDDYEYGFYNQLRILEMEFLLTRKNNIYTILDSQFLLSISPADVSVIL